MSASRAILSPVDAFALFADLTEELRERVSFACLGADGDLLSLQAEVPMGRDWTSLPIGELLRGALDCRAVSLLVAHNHPSGDPSPSRQDISATRRLASAAEAVGMTLLDHLVVASGGWASFRLLGLL